MFCFSTLGLNEKINNYNKHRLTYSVCILGLVSFNDFCLRRLLIIGMSLVLNFGLRLPYAFFKAESGRVAQIQVDSYQDVHGNHKQGEHVGDTRAEG